MKSLKQIQRELAPRLELNIIKGIVSFVVIAIGFLIVMIWAGGTYPY